MFDWNEVLTLSRNDLVALMINQSVEILFNSVLVDLELFDDSYSLFEGNEHGYRGLWIIHINLPL